MSTDDHRAPVPGGSWLAATWIVALAVTIALGLLDVVSWRTSAAVALVVTAVVFAIVIVVPTRRGP